MAHHIVEHAAALQRAAPEPRHVRTAVLFGGAGKIRPAGCRSAARPQQCMAGLYLRCKDLVLEVPECNAGGFERSSDLRGFGDGTCEWLLARDSAQCARAALERMHDLFEVLDARMVWTGDPERIDRRIRNHIAD